MVDNNLSDGCPDGKNHLLKISDERTMMMIWAFVFGYEQFPTVFIDFGKRKKKKYELLTMRENKKCDLGGSLF